MTRKVLLEPVSWFSALLLFGLRHGWGIAWAIALPRIIDLLDKSPRLAMLCILALVVAPGVIVAVLHRMTDGTIDRLSKERRRGLVPRLPSWWAGTYAWLVLYGASVLASILMLVIYPPEPDPGPDGGALAIWSLTARYLRGADAWVGVESAVWILVAAVLFGIERAGRSESSESSAA